MHVVKPLRRLVPHTRRGAIIATLATLTLGVGAAFAYYALLYGGSGSGSAALGSSSGGTGGGLTLSVKFSDGLMPGQSEAVDVSATNPTSDTYGLNKIHFDSITTSSPSCSANWFQFTPGSTYDESVSASNGDNPVVLQPGASWDWGSQIGNSGGKEWGDVQFLESGTDQSACEGATITISATAS